MVVGCTFFRDLGQAPGGAEGDARRTTGSTAFVAPLRLSVLGKSLASLCVFYHEVWVADATPT